MSLILHYHPLASFCWKVLIALYENDTPFERVIVDLGDEKSRAAFLKLWPHGKFPVCRTPRATGWCRSRRSSSTISTSIFRAA